MNHRYAGLGDSRLQGLAIEGRGRVANSTEGLVIGQQGRHHFAGFLNLGGWILDLHWLWRADYLADPLIDH